MPRSPAASAAIAGTIGRECKRNANVEGRYDPANAQTLAHSRRRAHLRRPKTGDLV
jgi:IS30 family transposase